MKMNEKVVKIFLILLISSVTFARYLPPKRDNNAVDANHRLQQLRYLLREVCILF